MSDNPVQRWHAHNPAATPTHADLKKGAAYAAGFADGHKQADRIEALTAELAKAVEALRDMCAEFRGYDLPYGSKAYVKATTIIAEIEGSNAP
jgi:hypothetical protein